MFLKNIGLRTQIVVFLTIIIGATLAFVYFASKSLVVSIATGNEVSRLTDIGELISKIPYEDENEAERWRQSLISYFGFESMTFLKEMPGEDGFMTAVSALGVKPFFIVDIALKGGGTAITEAKGVKKIAGFFRLENPDVPYKGFVIVASFRGILSGIEYLNTIFLMIFALVLLLVLVAGYMFLTFLVIKPLNSIKKGFEKLSAGEKNVDVSLKGSREFEALSRDFTLMSKSLQEKQSKIERQIVELRMVNENLSLAQDSLVRSEKLASVGVLAAGLAHEIGNPISIILGFLEIIKKSEINDEEIKGYLGEIEGATIRIHKVIKDLLVFARPSCDESGVCFVKDVIAHALHLLSPQKKFKYVEVRQNISGDELWAGIPAEKLEQVLVNILLNAADAMDGKGSIDISARRLGQKVEVVIKDYGKGISRANLPRIWDPFFTTKG
ncbi:MAG: hypothetical protein FJ088_00545, partial [Deltaproteobacteria bacterium]|nr:hypothetical protein [Deltaproteobacteria bacterium]